jgi:hypothetical protein
MQVPAVTHTDAEQQRCEQLLQLESGHCDVEGGRARFRKGVTASTAAEPILRRNSACARSLLPSMHPPLLQSSWPPSPPLPEHFPPTPSLFPLSLNLNVCFCVYVRGFGSSLVLGDKGEELREEIFVHVGLHHYPSTSLPRWTNIPSLRPRMCLPTRFTSIHIPVDLGTLTAPSLNFVQYIS